MNQTNGSGNLQLTRRGASVEGKKRLAIRDSFIKRTGPRLIHRRKHHAFKLYLLALWCHYPRGEPRLPRLLENKHLAHLLDIGGSEDTARSAVSRVLGDLEEEQLIRREREGRQRTILLCHETGNGQQYTRPRGGGENAYVELPGEFFTNGWLNSLSAPAILVTLVALREARFLTYRRSKQAGWSGHFDWFSPVSYLSDRYQLGATTIEKGIRELRACGFLTSRLTGRNPQFGRLMAPRNLYTNHLEIFEEESGAGV